MKVRTHLLGPLNALDGALLLALRQDTRHGRSEPTKVVWRESNRGSGRYT